MQTGSAQTGSMQVLRSAQIDSAQIDAMHAASTQPSPAQPPAAPAVTIRRSLVFIVIAALIPIGLFSAVLFYMLWQNQQEARDQEQLARVRTMAALVQSEVNSSINRLELLARSPLLSRESLPAFYAQLQMLLPDNEDWANLLLISREEQLINARIPYGTALPRLGDAPYQAQAFGTGKPSVSDLFRARTRPVDTLDIAVPVMRESKDGKSGKPEPAYLLIASLKAEHFTGLLGNMTGNDSVTALLDRNLRIIARTRGQETYAGQSAGGALAPAMRLAPEGVVRSVTKDGVASYTAWARLPAGWYVITAVPAEQGEAALARSLALLLGLWLLALLTGLIMARLLYRRIDRSLIATVEVANLRARGQSAAFPDATFGELVELSGAIDTLFEQERHARGEAEAANHAKDEFLAMLGHELRNPIGAITNASHLLAREIPGSPGDKLARRVIERQTANMKRMIDDLLDMSRVLSGKISLETSPIDLATSVRGAVETFAATGKTAEHIVETHLDPVWIQGDPARIDQILTNLVGNAVNYTPPGKHIRITLARDAARPVIGRAGAAAISSDGDAVLAVSDEGVGIAPQTLPRVFDLFFQETQRPDRPKSGLGLGLTLVRRLAQLHGGSVTAESPGLNRGTTFTVRLPAIATPLMQKEQAAPTAAGGRRVLIIEDNEDARDTLSTLLEIEGHTLATAADGPEGLQELKQFHADAVIIDVGLPGMDGYEVARAIRAAGGKTAGGQPLLLIALTGYGLPEDQKRARDAGFDAHFVKPADFDKLAALLARGTQAGA